MIEEQLYYLVSRGLSRLLKYLVVRGFLGPVIVQMPSAEIRRQLLEIIDRKLSGLEGGQEVDLLKRKETQYMPAGITSLPPWVRTLLEARSM